MKRYRTPERFDLVRLASSTPVTTITAARHALSAAGLKPMYAPSLLVASEHVARRRRGRALRAAPEGRQPTGRPPVQLPRGQLESRLVFARARAVLDAAQKVLRVGPRTDFAVTFSADSPPEARASGETYYITVAPTWRRDVLARGLATVTTGLTLAVEAVPAPAGMEAVICLIARNRRGHDVETDWRIYVRPVGGRWRHATDRMLLEHVLQLAGWGRV